MKVLLTTLNSKYVHSNLALRYMYAVAGNLRDHMEICEFTINQDDDYIITELMRMDTKLFCFSCYIWNTERILYIAECLKKANPNVQILLGGPEVSFEGEEFMFSHPYVDFVIQGEGEGIFSTFIRQFFQLMPNYEMILGLMYRNGSIVKRNKPCPLLKMETIPNPYDYYAAEPDKVIYYESSRGCPFRCAYCLSSIEKQLRQLPMERVKTDLNYFIYKMVKQVKFVDRTFNADSARATEILRYIVEKDNGVTNFHMEMCGELFTEEQFAVLEKARPGLFQFEIGVQSTNKATLDSINRRGDITKVEAAVKRLRKIGGIHLHLDLIAGLPLEDYSTFRRSFNDVYALRPDMLQLGFLKLLKGTQLREEAAMYGYVYRSKAPYEVITNSYISADGLVRLKMVSEMVDLFYNRPGFSATLEEALKFYDSPFSMYEELALWYYSRGHQQKSHKKEDIYRILRMFLRRWSKEDGDYLFDGVLREDMVSYLNYEAVRKFDKEGWALQ